MSLYEEICGNDAITKNVTLPTTALDDPLFEYLQPTGAGDAQAKKLLQDAFINSLCDCSDAVIGVDGACIKLETTPSKTGSLAQLVKDWRVECECKCACCVKGECEHCEAEKKCEFHLGAEPKTGKAKRKQHIKSLVEKFRRAPVFADMQNLLDPSGLLIWTRLENSLSTCLEAALHDFAR